MDDAVLAAAKAKIERLAREQSELARERGELLLGLRAQTAPEAFWAACEEECQVERFDAERAMRLAAWCAEHPDRFHRWSHLGPDRLYPFSCASWSGWARLEARLEHPKPDEPRITGFEEIEHYALVAELGCEDPDALAREMVGWMAHEWWPYGPDEEEAREFTLSAVRGLVAGLRALGAGE